MESICVSKDGTLNKMKFPSPHPLEKPPINTTEDSGFLQGMNTSYYNAGQMSSDFLWNGDYFFVTRVSGQ